MYSKKSSFEPQRICRQRARAVMGVPTPPHPPPSFFGYVSLEILLLPTRRPTSRQPELLPGPGDSRPSYLSKSRKRVFFTSVPFPSSVFYFAAFSTDSGLIESKVQRRRQQRPRRRRQRRQTECHQHFVVSTNCRSCYVSLVWASLLFELCHVSKNFPGPSSACPIFLLTYKLRRIFTSAFAPFTGLQWKCFNFCDLIHYRQELDELSFFATSPICILIFAHMCFASHSHRWRC